MFDSLLRLFRSSASEDDKLSDLQRPLWASAVSVLTEPIQVWSELALATLLASNTQPQGEIGNRASTTVAIAEGTPQPLAGARNAVPWPSPPPQDAEVFTYWGRGSGKTSGFTLQGDAALRIVAKSGPFRLRIRRRDGTFLVDSAEMAGRAIHLGLMAISAGGTYSLVIQAPDRVRWGVTVVARGLLVSKS